MAGGPAFNALQVRLLLRFVFLDFVLLFCSFLLRFLFLLF